MKVEIYTDGSAKVHTSKVGGWAFYCRVTYHHNSAPLEFWRYGAEKDTTSNRMEITAIIEAMKFLWTSNLLAEDITIISDSQYCVNGCTKWIHGWIKRGFINSQDKEVKNRDLWEKINNLLNRVNPKFQWVRGHNGQPGNERVDKLAVMAAERFEESIENE